MSSWVYADVALVIGLAYAVVAGDAAIARPDDGGSLAGVTLAPGDGRALRKDGVLWLNRALGRVERALYFCALAVGGNAALIVPAWLAIKFIGVADLQASRTDNELQHRDRRLFQRAQVLNVVSLGYAAVGWKISEFLGQKPEHHYLATPARRWVEAGTVAVGLPLLTLWLRHQIAKDPPDLGANPESTATEVTIEVTIEVTK